MSQCHDSYDTDFVTEQATGAVGGELAGGSVRQQALYRHLTAHAIREEELLAGCQQAVDESSSGAFRYLAAMILEDEERHHRLFAELTRTIQSVADDRKDVAVPRLGQWGFERSHIVKMTQALLDCERADAHELQDLAIELDAVEDRTMWQLLVRLMQADTAKHIEILEFVNGHAAASEARGSAPSLCMSAVAAAERL
jgi:hypothetical protein